jgi:hypothetical protein
LSGGELDRSRFVLVVNGVHEELSHDDTDKDMVQRETETVKQCENRVATTGLAGKEKICSGLRLAYGEKTRSAKPMQRCQYMPHVFYTSEKSFYSWSFFVFICLTGCQRNDHCIRSPRNSAHVYL